MPASPNGRAPARALVVGLDGATFDLIKPWAEQGHLPTLARLLRDGAHGPLRSTIPPMTAPAWTAFATGTNPGRHGLYDWVAREPGTYRFVPVTARDTATPTLYRLLSENGRRVCTLNVPMTYPPAPVNGLQLSGMPAPAAGPAIAYPPEAYTELHDALGDYILYPDPGQAYSDAGIDRFLDRLYRCTDLRVRAFDHLLARERWDFAMVVFNGTDTISHALWKFMDRDHPLHDPSRAGRYGHAIRDYYAHVDRRLAPWVDALDDDTTLVLMSDHGFGPFHKFIHVNNWLLDQGLMHIRPGFLPRLKSRLFRAGFSPMNVYDALMRLGLGALKREVVRGQGQGLLKTLFLSFEDVDWSRTVAYSLGNVGQIYLNVAGREPAGCVDPADYDAVRDEIIARLARLRDPATGEEVVDAIHRREEIYAGERLSQAPDILFIPRRLEYFGFGEYEFGSHRVIEPMRRGISGTHRLNGIFLAYGRHIRPTAVAGAALPDLAPTILHLMGENIPAHMDGRPLDILAPGFTPTPAPAGHWYAPDHDGDAGALTDAERDILSERLRDLGYVG